MNKIIGGITPPAPFAPGTGYGDINTPGGGIIGLLNNILRLLVIIGGIWAFFNLVLAGYGFLSASDDPKKMEQAWQKIWQSLLGLLFIVASFVLAAIFGYIIFGRADAILKPQLYGPGV